MKVDRNHKPRQTSEEITTLLSRYRASGLGLERFAREQGIPPGRLHYWLYQKQRGRFSRRLAKPAPLAAAPVFQEIQLAGGTSLTERWAAEMNLPGGRVIRFSTAASAEWIGAVVQTLQRPC